MANSLYDKGRQKFLDGSISWSSDNIKAKLLSSSYTPNLATHELLSDVSGSLATSTNFGTKTSTAGVADADDVTFAAVASGSTGTYVLLYKDTGTAGTSPLIGLIDTATNLPVTTNNGDITVSWDAGANKIFKL